MPKIKTDLRRENIDKKRRRRARYGDQDGFDSEEQPAYVARGDKKEPIPHHDVLVVAPKGVHGDDQYYRFPVVKKPNPGERAGQYVDPPELLDPHDLGQRKVVSSSRPREWNPCGQQPEWGPAFATLPVKPEPAATSCATCYLINTQNLEFINAWTAEEWVDDPGGVNTPGAKGADDREFEALLAGPRGKVFRVRFEGIDAWEPEVQVLGETSGGASVTVECVNLRSQMEVWNQLRNGCVVGRVLLRDVDANSGGRVVPLVNITTLRPRSCDSSSEASSQE